MNARNLCKKVTITFVLICISAACVWADKMQLQEKLSKDVKIQMDNVTIADALEKIGQKAGVKFILSDEAVWKLPYGEATRLSVTLNGPLADSLTEMLNTLFMRYAVGPNDITIYPRQELEHILGRATTKQLELLKVIYTKTIRTYISGDAQRTINSALGQEIMVLPISKYQDLDVHLDVLRGKDSKWRIEYFPGQLISGPRGGYVRSKTEKKYVFIGKEQQEQTNVGKECQLSAPVTLSQLLDEVAYDESTWYLSGMDLGERVPEIRIVSINNFREAKLDQLIDISCKDQEVGAVIRKLAGWSGMELYLEGDQLDEKISVDMQNIKLGQALRNIVSTVNGKMEIDVGGNKILIFLPSKPKEVPPIPKTGKGGGKADAEGYVGKISIPMDGGKYYIEFMLRASDLTDSLKKLRDEKMKEVLG